MAAALLGAREAVMSPIRPILRAHELTEQQWRLLRILMDNGPMDISRAAELSMIMAPSLTRIVRDLTQRKLISKNKNADDARKSTLSICPAGQTLVEQTAMETIAHIERYQSQFGQDRFDRLLAELNDFTHLIQQDN